MFSCCIDLCLQDYVRMDGGITIIMPNVVAVKVVVVQFI